MRERFPAFFSSLLGLFEAVPQGISEVDVIPQPESSPESFGALSNIACLNLLFPELSPGWLPFRSRLF